MTENKRIALNVVATYGRSLYALAIGLLCGRWTLMALGATDYGLVGLVGGLTGFVTFFNGLLSFAVGRFYAVSVGQAKKSGNEVSGLEDCRKWFCTAFSLHSVVPIVLVCVGYPIGVWAVRHFLTIPPERVDACVWVWRFTCVTCFVGMFDVPFKAMYTAKQEIAELTIYSFFTSTATALFQYYMVTHPGDWLVRYSMWTCFLSVTPSVVIGVRAVFKYKECRLRVGYLWNVWRIKQIAIYAFSRFWSAFSRMVFSQGRAILVNKYMGPVYNASMSVGNNIAHKAVTLSSSLSGAFWPAISNKAGEGKKAEVERLCFMVCRIGTLGVLVFALPLATEADTVLKLWLVKPPPFAPAVCVAVLINIVFERMTDGYWMSVMALGRRVVIYSFTVGWANVAAVVVAWILFAAGYGMWSVCVAIAGVQMAIAALRVALGRKLVGYSPWYWIRRIFLPILLVTAVPVAIGTILRFFLAPSFVRVMVTTLAEEAVFVPLSWFALLETGERAYVSRKLQSIPFLKRTLP